MNILKDIHHTINEEERLLTELELLIVEHNERRKGKFTITEIEYNPDGSVEWNPEQAKPPRGAGGGINRDTGAGMERRRKAATPRIGDVVLLTNERGQVIPAAVSDVNQNTGILTNKRHNFKQKIDMTTLRPAQGNVAKRFTEKHPNRTFWQVNA